MARYFSISPRRLTSPFPTQGNAFTVVVIRLAADGDTSQIAPPPNGISLKLYRSLQTVDPVSGKFIVLASVQNGNDGYDENGYGYNRLSGVWRSLTMAGTSCFSLVNNGVLQTPLNEYGVILFIAVRPTITMWLYKHNYVERPISLTAFKVTPLP